MRVSGTNRILSRRVGLAVHRQMYVQLDRERGSLANPAIDTDGAMVSLDYAVHDREPQTRSLPKRFGCEEWAEYLIDVLWEYAKSCVLNLYDY